MADEAPGQPPDGEIITAGLVVIGDEILSGRTVDKNMAYIAGHLTAIGIRLAEVRVVPDIHERIVQALDALRSSCTYVLTTGGIGPTHDDITADAVAAALGRTIGVDQRAVDLMLAYYEERGMELTPARLRMARIPEGAELIRNAISRAPGFMVDNVIVLAGIPSVMQVMLDDVTPRLRKGRAMLSVTIDVDYPESEVAGLLGEAQHIFADVAMGSYPFLRDRTLGTQIVLRSTDADRLGEVEASLRRRLRDAGLIP